MLVIGVDTGKDGAIVALNKSGKIVHKSVFSLGPYGINFQSYLCRLNELKGRATRAYVEEVHAIYGSRASSTFTFGRNFQSALDGLMAADIPLTLVRPREWQKVITTGKILKKDSKRLDTKAMALATALEHYDYGEFLKSPRSTVAHDGLVDATLIARYGLEIQKEQGEM